MRKSISVTSGFKARNISTASRPLAASPTRSMSASLANSDAMPFRTSGWSSAQRTRMESTDRFESTNIHLLTRQREHDRHRCPYVGDAGELELRSNMLGAFFHSQD